MKSLRKVLLCAFVIGATVISCKDQSSLQPLNPGKPLDLTGQLEKELGTKLATKEVKFTDITGLSSVTIRFIGQSEDVINGYLEKVDYSIIPIKNRNEYFAGSKALTIDPKTVSQKSGPATLATIYTEVVSINLASDAIGFKTRVKSIAQADPNARPAYNYYATHVSPDWCEWSYVQNNTTTRNISWNLEGKDHWYESWYHFFYYWTVPPGYSSGFEHDTYRARIGVDYDQSGDYTYWFLCD